MNLYKENPALKFQLGHPLMEKIVALKEQNFADKDKYDYAPQDFEDAMDSYEKVLEIVGEIWDEHDEKMEEINRDYNYIMSLFAN